MSKLALLALTLLDSLLIVFNNWLDAREVKKYEEHVADVRADPAAHWLRKFGGTEDKRPATSSADTGSSGDT